MEEMKQEKNTMKIMRCQIDVDKQQKRDKKIGI